MFVEVETCLVNKNDLILPQLLRLMVGDKELEPLLPFLLIAHSVRLHLNPLDLLVGHAGVFLEDLVASMLRYDNLAFERFNQALVCELEGLTNVFILLEPVFQELDVLLLDRSLLSTFKWNHRVVFSESLGILLGLPECDSYLLSDLGGIQLWVIHDLFLKYDLLIFLLLLLRKDDLILTI